MKEWPIIFSTPMVRAILEGRKTQTRLPVNPKLGHASESEHVQSDVWRFALNNPYIKGQRPWRLQRAPYKVGSRLWVREPWKAPSAFDKHPPCDIPVGTKTFYVADDGYIPSESRRRDARHMPRWASRITLEVTDVRVERLQDISEADACDEGMGSPITRDCKVPKFAALWDQINGPGSWEANPWVWVVEFKKLDEVTP